MRQDRGYAALNESRLHYLWWGCDLFDWDHANWIDEQEKKLCWDNNKEKILNDWMQQPRNAGRRPWAWWWFEHGCKPPLTLAGQPREALALLAMGDLQPWEVNKLNEWNKGV
jgi:hypothetical protein